jgi:hypothetical protein
MPTEDGISLTLGTNSSPFRTDWGRDPLNSHIRKSLVLCRLMTDGTLQTGLILEPFVDGADSDDREAEVL